MHTIGIYTIHAGVSVIRSGDGNDHEGVDAFYCCCDTHNIALKRSNNYPALHEDIHPGKPMVCVGSSSTQSPTGLTTPAAANSTYMYKRCWQRAVTLTGLCCLHAARQLQGIGNAINITSCPPPHPLLQLPSFHLLPFICRLPAGFQLSTAPVLLAVAYCTSAIQSCWP